MSSLPKNPQKDWTHLLTDPQLVEHIGTLLQAYRQAPPEKREESLLAAMRQIQNGSIRSADEKKPATQEASPRKSDPEPSAHPPFTPDLFKPSVGQDRRTYPRLRCFIAVELRCEGWDVPVWGNLANLSASGCFIETLEPVRKSTKLEIGLWANNGKIWVKGVVVNGVVTENNPAFGVRLKFTNMEASDRDTLRFFLKFVEDTTKHYENQNGYLAQLKR
jgi:PilZ domain